MQYEPPYGTTGNTSYVNGNPATGQQGSIPPAAAIQNPMTEIVNAITNSGFTPSDGDLEQLSRALRQGNNYLVATGTANNYSVTSNLPLDTYRQGLTLRVQIPISNTGDSFINVDGLGPRHIINTSGTNLASGQMAAGGIVELTDDGTEFQLVNGSVSGSTGPTGATGATGPAGPSSPTRILYLAPGSGNITVAGSGETRAKVKGWGGGGGGGGSFGVNSGGAGGGGGGYFECLVTGLTATQVIPWTVGSGGNGGTGAPTGGSNGGGTTFGTYATANGGGGGGGGTSGPSVGGGGGGTGSLAGGVNGFTVQGGPGGAAAEVVVQPGSVTGIYAGAGGASFGASVSQPALSTQLVPTVGFAGNPFGGGGQGGGWGAGGAVGAEGFLIVEMLP